MVKWIRLSASQYLGFWAPALLLFAMQEIPYMLMPLFKLEANPIMNMRESSVFLDTCEKVLGCLCVILMTFTVHKDAALFSASETREQVFLALSAAALLLNFIGWGLYFAGYQSVFVMMLFIVTLPPLYYFFIGLWRKNTLLAAAGCVFLLVHFTHVLLNLTRESTL